MRKITSILLFIALVGIGTFYYFQHKENFHLITTLSIGAVFVILVISLTIWFCYGLQLKILADHYRLNLNFLEWFGLPRVTLFINMWLPLAGGASMKAFYLKKAHGFKYSSFIASMGITNIIKLMITSLFAIILLWFFKEEASMLLFSVAGTIFIGTLTFLLFAHMIRWYHFLPSNYLKSVIDEWQKIRTDHKTIKKLIMVNVFIFFFTSLLIYFAFQAFTVDISLISSGIIAAFTIITGVVNLIPGNFGIREAVIIAISGIHGIESNEGLHAAILIRVIGIIWTLVFAPLFVYKLFPKIRKPIMEKVGIKPNQAVQE